MNDRHDAGYGGDQYELVGYDEYGQPVYRQVPPQQAAQQSYDPYGQQQYQGQQGQTQGQGHGQQGYGYDPYATGGQQTPAYDPYDTGSQAPTPAYDPYGTATRAPYDPYGQTAAGQQPRAEQSRTAEQTAYIPQQAGPAESPVRAGVDGDTRPGAGSGDAAADARDGTGDVGQEQREYHTEQFAFVEEPDGDSEDVIDWLNFTENRTERREEAKRRARSRLVALVVVLALVAVGGVGYLWYAGKLPGLSSSSDSGAGGTTAAAAQKRDVVVVHLHDTAGGGTSTALLVDNTTTKQGTTVLLPNSLVLTQDDGTTTTLAKSVDDDGSDGTRGALDTVLGTSIQGTWRLDTPYLQNLVDLVGGIEVDTDTAVPGPNAKKGEAPLVAKGEKQTLSGKMAVAYATHRAEGEAQNAQLQRFGQVMQGVLRKVSSDAQGATVTVQTLAQILDPSLTDKDLGAFLAKLADLAKGGDYKTALLPVQADGTLSAQASAGVVKGVLGGTAKSPDKDAAVSVFVQNASGAKANTEDARVVLLNGGFTFVEGGAPSGTKAASQVLYGDAADKANAVEVAKTLGLDADAVKKGAVSGNADVAVVLGKDYKRSSTG
ncbi:anionic cell wall polymer biosynthesis LytR-Cps2A-Psr (LCP) family protein [Streptomyces sp. B4I13]|uniref:LCP family protein n=1 Tax=Streptomyces sp. B4I13 TaxID=3042271 RepID=UPI0027881B49|nr:LCP family protein [Streptomyces sp. B4I13]MDQ0961817.1 anionic cell wall polymer biosynthesis LytR-Cps2A-Psr (LCP) family protein [Streptomyces sp. B4I13]